MACCESCATGGPCAGACGTPSTALAPSRSTAAGRGLAHAFAGGRPHELTIDCGGMAARVRVERLPGGDTVRLSGEALWGATGRARAVIEVDAPSFDHACEVADAHGGLPRLAAILGDHGFALGVGLDARPLLGRG